MAQSQPYDIFDEKLVMRVAAVGAAYHVGSRVLKIGEPSVIESGAVGVAAPALGIALAYAGVTKGSLPDVPAIVYPVASSAGVSYAFSRSVSESALAGGSVYAASML